MEVEFEVEGRHGGRRLSVVPVHEARSAASGGGQERSLLKDRGEDE